MKKMMLLISIFSLVNLFVVSGQIVAGWDFDPINSYISPDPRCFGPSPYDPTFIGSNVTIVGLTRGPGLSINQNSAANAWGATGWDSGISSLPSAVTAGDYVTFSITSNQGYTLSFASISPYNIRISGSSPTTGQWQYQVGTSPFVNIGNPINWGNNFTSAGNPQSTIILTNINSLQNLNSGITVTFRIVNWGATSNGTTWYFNDPNGQPGDDLIINAASAAEIPAPVELAYFSANNDDANVILTWQTASEQNNSHFSIEKSTDGSNFLEIGREEGQGTTLETPEYQFTDFAPSTGVSYYRLRQIDFDGNFTFSNIASADFKGKEKTAIYPTPTTGRLNIKPLESFGPESDLMIFDKLGRLLKALSIDEDAEFLELDVTDLPVPTYFLKLR
jgi:hypothetical protein